MSGAFPDRAQIDPETKQVVYSTPEPPAQASSTDARKRSIRVLLQGLAFDVLFAVVLLLYPLVGSADSDWTTLDWRLMAVSVVKTIVVTIFAFLMRRFRIVPATL